MTVAEREPVCGLSKLPKANIWVRISDTSELTVAWLSVPAVRAAVMLLASENGIATAMPALASPTAEPAAPQSEVTKPP